MTWAGVRDPYSVAPEVLTADAITLVDGARLAVEDYWQREGTLPPDLAAVGLAVLTVTKDVREAIIRGEDLVTIRQIARASGMRTLAESAFDMILEGDTTPEEAVRVLGGAFWEDLIAMKADDSLDTPS